MAASHIHLWMPSDEARLLTFLIHWIGLDVSDRIERLAFLVGILSIEITSVTDRLAFHFSVGHLAEDVHVVAFLRRRFQARIERLTQRTAEVLPAALIEDIVLNAVLPRDLLVGRATLRDEIDVKARQTTDGYRHETEKDKQYDTEDESVVREAHESRSHRELSSRRGELVRSPE